MQRHDYFIWLTPLRVVEEVVEAAVGQAVAGVGPLEDGLPAVGDEGVDAAGGSSESKQEP